MPLLAARTLPHTFWAEGQSLPLTSIILMVGLVAWVAVSWRAVLWYRRARRRSEPLRAFVRLARAQGLGWSDIHALRRAARAQQLTTPLTLLVCQATLLHQLDAAGENLPPRARADLQRRTPRIAERLFA